MSGETRLKRPVWGESSDICMVSYITTDGYPVTKALLMPGKMDWIRNANSMYYRTEGNLLNEIVYR